MPFAFGGTGTGGSGGGLLLRTPPDTFNGATRTAAETARDAGITDTTPFDDNPNLAIILTWPVTPTNTVYQVRRGSAWADVTGVVRGPMGLIGNQGRFDVYCYDNAETVPTTPTGGTYVLSTGVLTVPTGTTAAPVEPTGNAVTWRSQATINPAIQSGSVTPTWSAFTTDVEAALAARAETAETGAEAAQTAAEAAQAAAETAQTGAQTAETDAEAAETAAESAQTGAESARAGAELALASSGAALAFADLWSGDIDLQTANQWVALGTEAVPSNATWLLWNGGTLTDGANDGPAALWTWINAADWRALTADTVGTTAGDGTGMLFADWCASDIGDGTPDFTRRDAVIGRTSADIPLIMGPQTGESYFGARLMYITQAVATPGGGGGASSFAGLSDTPSALGAAGQLVRMNTGATALEFFTQTVATFLGLTDTPAAFGSATQILQVNSGGTGLEFVNAPAGGGASSFADLTGSIANSQVPDTFTRDTELAVYALLAGAVFTGAVSVPTPTANLHAANKAYVDGLVNPEQSHTNYIAVSADTTFDSTEFTEDATGNSSLTNSLIVPTFTGNRYIAIAVPDAVGDIIGITQGGFPIFTSWERISGTIPIPDVTGEEHKVWRTTAIQSDLASGITYEITHGTP